MARSEARILVTIWNDVDYRGRTVDDQWLYEALMSQKDLTHLGVIPLRIPRWARLAADMTVERVRAALDRLAAAGFVIVDDESCELLVRSLMRRDGIYRQPNILKAAASVIDDVESPRIRSVLRDELRRIAAAPDIRGESVTIVAAMLAELENGSLDPSPNPSGKGSRKDDADPSRGSLGEREDLSTTRTKIKTFPLTPQPQPPLVALRP